MELGEQPLEIGQALRSAPGGGARMRVLHYSGESLVEKEVVDLEALQGLVQPGTTTWVDVAGLEDPVAAARLAELFEVHQHALTEVIDARLRPKLEDFGTAFLIHVRTLRIGPGGIVAEPVGMILGAAFVLSFRPTGCDPFEPVREQIRQGRFRIRNSGPGHLAYAILDAVMESYFPALERFEQSIDGLEGQVTRSASPETSVRIQELKREIARLSQLAASMRELLAHLARVARRSLISKKTRLYIREVRDHALRVEETLESYRQLSEGLYETYVSTLNTRTNEVVKLLTVIATIFLPLNFIASFFGMNFRRIQVIDWPLSVLVALMVLVAGAMLLWFRKKRWL